MERAESRGLLLARRVMEHDQLLRGKSVLVIEDEYFIADELARALTKAGAVVLGPVGRIEDALAILEKADALDAAILDINLHGQFAFGIADALRKRGVPFVFATGYDEAAVPLVYSAAPRLQKPLSAEAIATTLLEAIDGRA